VKGNPDISILGTNAFDDQQASEKVVWTFFLIVGVCIELLGVTVESISSGKTDTRYWTGEQGAAAVVAAKECPGGNIECLLPACRDTKGVLDSGAWLLHQQTVSNPGSWIFFLTALYMYITN